MTDATPPTRIEITEDDWTKKFAPIQNPRLSQKPEGQWMTDFGFDPGNPTDAAFLKNHAETNCWTVVDTDGPPPSLAIINGRHIVNRVCYIITEKPWRMGHEYNFALD